MADCENPLKIASNNVARSDGNCGNGLKTSEQRKLTGELSKIKEISARKIKAKWREKCTFKALIILVPVLVLVVVNVIVLGVVLTKSSSGPCPATTVLSCPSGWVGYEGRCYYFSDAEGTWNYSQSNCSAYSASLAAIENQKEMDFIMRYKVRADHWFGLWREKEDQPWKWTNGSFFNKWFKIGANGLCAYLDDDSARSTWCDTDRNWICSKSLSTSEDKRATTKSGSSQHAR